MPTATQTIKRLELAADRYMNGMYIEHITGYTWVQALRDAGYSESYTQARCADLWTKAQPMIDELRKTLEIKQNWDLEWIDNEYKDLYNECRGKSDKTNAKGCLDSMSRRLAGFTDKISSTNEEITSLTPEQEAITDEAVRLAKIKLAQGPELTKTG